MSTQTINISLPKDLVKELDSRARQVFSSRSDYIRKAVVNQIKNEQTAKAILDRANKRGQELGFDSEESVYDEINA